MRAEVGGPGGEAARVRFTKEAAPWVRERFGDGARSVEDGGVEVELPAASPAWVIPYVLSFGGEASIVAPPSLRDALRDAVKRLRDNF